MTYFVTGSDSISAKDDGSNGQQQAVLADASSEVKGATLAASSSAEPPATATPAPTRAPIPTSVPTATPAPTKTSDAQPTPEPTAGPEAAAGPKVYPDTQFGEVLEEGMIQLKLPGGEQVDAWYTFQVDTKTRDIIVLFALYDGKLETILSTVKVENYSRAASLDNAEVTLNYTDGSDRILYFDGKEGTLSLTQHYPVPYGPSLFTSDLRRALVFYGMGLQDESSGIDVLLHLDLSGLSESESLEFKRLMPSTVKDVLLELRSLIDQIEDKRMR